MILFSFTVAVASSIVSTSANPLALAEALSQASPEAAVCGIAAQFSLKTNTGSFFGSLPAGIFGRRRM